MPPLNVALVPGPDQVVVRLTGEADLSTAALLADALAQAAGLGTSRVVVDVAAARFWDCSALHVLADFTADLARAARRCRIVGASAATRRLVVLADFSAALELDGPVDAPAVAPPTEPHRCPPPVVPTAPPTAGTPPPPAGLLRPSAAGRRDERGHRRSRVPEHPAPARRRTLGSHRGSALSLRRWR
ncbi:STAS domain-containing protein [Geodermatophilus sp. YIM 151500]|uniref:STAS domain-containing protein n=1 Tax=Geodermatophilus sp. YIM 151500 TaxID=2984531 RepID=UPI0021E4FC88|nr:STAS domain-containing protein [Geodermatophilus sp. YIM 151500]MCV2491551.1 STAS domain-containing protein [Geodermatophilus sp. YIM 151500]